MVAAAGFDATPDLKRKNLGPEKTTLCETVWLSLLQKPILHEFLQYPKFKGKRTESDKDTCEERKSEFISSLMNCSFLWDYET